MNSEWITQSNVSQDSTVQLTPEVQISTLAVQGLIMMLTLRVMLAIAFLVPWDTIVIGKTKNHTLIKSCNTFYFSLFRAGYYSNVLGNQNPKPKLCPKHAYCPEGSSEPIPC